MVMMVMTIILMIVNPSIDNLDYLVPIIDHFSVFSLLMLRKNNKLMQLM